MAGNTIVVNGDSSSHGGTVISASSNMTINGKGIARIGDQHSCPIAGHGITAIVSSPNSTSTANGEVIAVTGSVVGCGAVLTGSETGFSS